jgi:heme A synthase
VPASDVGSGEIWLHRFAVLTAGSTFLLIVAGGLVTSTGSGLAVPDWPLSYGTLFPPMVGGILYEHTHRVVAAFVGLLTAVLAAWLWKCEPRRWVRNLGFVSLAAVVLQGILGGLTVLYRLPTPISVIHACLAQTFFLSHCGHRALHFGRVEETAFASGRRGATSLGSVHRNGGRDLPAAGLGCGRQAHGVRAGHP